MSILTEIIAQKEDEIARIDFSQTNESPIKHKSFINQLKPAELHLIAEVKQASPSKGIIYPAFDHMKLAHTFESSGASCISVLTDEVFFKGSKDFLIDIKKKANIPILRKDFIIDPKQVKETHVIGADVMLLIVDILSVNQTNELVDAARSYGLEVLLEIHSHDALKKLNHIHHKPLVGVNNRDLNTFECDINRVIEMKEDILSMDSNIKIIAESGYFETNQMNDLQSAGMNGVLIGEGLSKNNGILEWFKK